MRNLKLSEWASIAEIAGTLAVVVSLFFVVYSLERNTAALSAQTADDTYDSIRDVELAVLSDPQLMKITLQGRGDFAGLSDFEKEWYMQWVVTNLDIWERMYSRENDGILQSDTIIGWHGYFQEWTTRHVSKDMWQQIKWYWPEDEDFLELVESALPD